MAQHSPPRGPKDHQPPVFNHPPNVTSPSFDSMQLDSSVNQGAGSAADPEKWTRFITVVPGQDGRFKIKFGANSICGGFSDVWECDAKFSDGTTISASKQSSLGHFLHLLKHLDLLIVQVAVKKFRAVRIPSDADENAVTSKLLKRLNKELQIWMGLKHPNIAPLLGFVLVGELCTLSPWYPNGNVASYLGLHPEADKIKLVTDVACGLAYLHNRTPPVIHGDMKPDNVLINKTGDAVIIDFGLSSVIEDDPTLAKSFTSASLQDAGNARWMAPELIMTAGCSRSFSTDIYSFGSVALFIYTGELPFKSISNIQIFHALIQGQKPVTNRDDYPAISAADAKWFYKLLVSCWSAKPNSRPSIRTVEERMRSRVIPTQHRSHPALPETTSTRTPIPANPSSSPPSNSIITPAAVSPSSTSPSAPFAPPESIYFGSNTASRPLPGTPSRNQRLEPHASKLSAPSAPRPPTREQTSIVRLFGIPVVVSVDAVFDAARLAACCASVPGLAPVVETLRIINTSVERVSWNKDRCRKLSTKAMILVFIICDYYDNERTDTGKMQTAIERTVQAMHDIDLDVREWAALSFWKSWYSRHDIDSKIIKHEDNLKNLTEFLSLAATLQIHDKVAELQEMAATLQIHDKVAELQESLETHPIGSAVRKWAQEQLYRLRNAPPKELAALTPPELACECVRLGSQPEHRGPRHDIWKGRWLDKQDVALIFYREYKMGARDENGIRRFERQIKVWRRLDNPYVLRLYGWCKFEGETYLVSPWLQNRDVLKYLDGDRGRHKKCLALITEIALGLRYIHNMDFIHGSIKPSNILICDDGRAVLSDFSLAKIATPHARNTETSPQVNVFRYQAPEVILDEPISKASDVYSWAMTALEIITGDPPFHPLRTAGRLVNQVITQSAMPNRSDYTSPVLDEHPEIWDLFVLCWKRQAAERPTAKEIVEAVESIPASPEY